MPAGSVGSPPQFKNYQAWSNISATPIDFNLDAAVFGITVHATTWGSAQLKRLLADGSTYVATAGLITGDGYTEIDLPAGQYQLVLTGVTGLTGTIEKIGRRGGR